MSGALFIDEAGDPGFKFRDDPASSSSELLVIAGVFFPSRASYARWSKECRSWLGKRTEFKHSTATGKAAMSFTHKALEVTDWWWYAIACHKQELWFQGWDPERLYRTLATFMLEGIAKKAGRGIDVVFDARDFPQPARDDLEVAMRGSIRVAPRWAPGGERYESGFVDEIRFTPSEQSPGVQLADLIAGACRESNQTQKAPRHQLHDVLRARGHCRLWPGPPKP